MNPSAVAQHYNDLDHYYRTIWGEHLHHGLWEPGVETSEQAVHRLVDKVAEAGEIRAGARVFDVGCGYGATARYLHRKYQAAVTGITLSQAQYHFALRETQAGGPKFLCGNWLEAEVPDGSQDMVLSIESTEHMDKHGFFSRAARALKPGGRLVICAWLRNERLPRWQERHLIDPICSEGRLESMGTFASYQKWMEEHGFENIQTEDLSRKVDRTWTLCVTGLLKHILKDSQARKFLLSQGETNRVFAKTVFRIWLAYQTGAMQFGLFSGRKS